MKSYSNILLINFGGIGDEILFSPVIHNLKKTFPQCSITLCLEGRSKAFINLSKEIDNYFCVDIKTKNKYIEMMKLYFKAISGHYDLVISSGSNPMISLLLFLTGIKTRVGYETNNLSKKLLTYSIKLNKEQYAGNMYFDLVKPITNGEFELPQINIEEQEKIPNSVIIHPGVSAISISKNITKTITAEKWAELIIKLLNKGKKVYLAGGPDDETCINKIRDLIKNSDLTNFTDLYGKTKNIYELAQLIKSSETLICSDSAPVHIGVATNSRTIGIFGPTNDKQLLPDSKNFIAINNSCACRPCLWAKRQTTCKELICLDIDVNDIVNSL